MPAPSFEVTMEFIVNEPVTFSRGRFGLTPAQSSARRHVLRELEDGTFEPVADIMFKRGERVQILSPVPKGMIARLTPAKSGAAVEVESARAGEEPRRRRRA